MKPPRSLVDAITERRDINLVQGAVRCVAIFIDELGEPETLQVYIMIYTNL